jgi:Tol biopolymer transport system component
MKHALRRMSLLAPVLIAALVAVALVPTTARATFSGQNGKIAFTRAGTNGIFVMNPDGHGVKRLTTGFDSGASFSPDGARVAFVRGWQSEADAHKAGIYVVRIDGTHAHRISGALRGWAQPPAWSPDGRWIAYEDLVVGWDPKIGDETYHGAIYVVRPSGSGLTKLTGYTLRNAQPQWSPDSTRITFSRGPGKTGNIMVMNRDGTGVAAVTHTPGILNFGPEWSPDGTTILFVRAAANRRSTDVYAIAPTGSDERRLTAFHQSTYDPTWSPDGTRIALVVTDSTGTGHLWTMAPDGTGQRDLTPSHKGWLETAHAWSPDSTTILYQDDGDLCTMSDEASPVEKELTATKSTEYVDDWQAVPGT